MRQNILTEPMGLLFKRIAVPGMLGMTALGLYQFVDAIFVGQLVGPLGLSAISIVSPIPFINYGVTNLFGIGSATLLSRAMGSGEKETIEKIFWNLGIWIFLLSALITVAFLIFAEPVVRLLGAENDELVEKSALYLRIIMTGSFFHNFAYSSNQLIRNEGKMTTAMVLLGIGLFLNILLDPLFIHVLGLGVPGAGFATVISQFVMLAIGLGYFFSGRSTVPVKRFALAPELMPKILSVGFSAFLMQLMTLVQHAVAYRTIADYGGIADIAVLGAVFRLNSFCFLPLWGIAQALQPVIGMNYGAGKGERIGSGFLFFTAAGTALAGVLWLAIIIFPRTILSWFISDPEIVRGGYQFMRIAFSGFFLTALSLTPITLFQAMGKAGHAIIVVVVKQFLFFVPFMILLPYFAGLDAAAFTFPLNLLLTCVLAVFLIRKDMGRISEKGD